ncbi:MAG: BrnT family toxin [Treponema sp.]|nr:BrnT family toxin [Treponema sp.]
MLDLFKDPFFIEWYDKEHSTLEEDWLIGIGSFDRRIYFYLSFTERKRIRIISARLAEPLEKKYYDKNFRQQIGRIL